MNKCLCTHPWYAVFLEKWVTMENWLGLKMYKDAKAKTTFRHYLTRHNAQVEHSLLGLLRKRGQRLVPVWDGVCHVEHLRMVCYKTQHKPLFVLLVVTWKVWHSKGVEAQYMGTITVWSASIIKTLNSEASKSGNKWAKNSTGIIYWKVCGT